MANEKQYRFSLTAAEIERLLLSISDKLTATEIVYDYTAGGEEGKVAAASAVKNMWLKLNEMVTGEGLKNAINAAEDSNVFTDADKEALSRQSYKFVGSPADILARDDIDTTKFTGGELILLQKNISGNPELQYWKRTPVVGGTATFAWESLSASGSNDTQLEIPVVGTQLLKKVPKTLFHMVEFRIHAKEENTGHWQSIDGKLGYRGEDLIVSLYNLIQTKDLVTYDFDQTLTDMEFNITTLVPDVKVWLAFVTGF